VTDYSDDTHPPEIDPIKHATDASAGRSSSGPSPASFRQSGRYTRCQVTASTPKPEGGDPMQVQRAGDTGSVQPTTEA
jgi:hypothetical protein